MAATEPLLALLLFLRLSVLGSAKAELEIENGTLRADDFPTNATAPSETTENQSAESLGPRNGLLPICSCDLHPGFCDLNCCCDSSCGSECNLNSPECPFSFCLPGSIRATSHICLEKSLIFRNNTPYRTEILADGCTVLFCIQLNDSRLNYLEKPQAVTKENFAALSAQYGGSSFISVEQVQPSPFPFYRVGDPIQTYFPSTSVLSVLKQPVGMGTSQLCIDENPAGFLESKSTSCIRIFTDLVKSCTTDPTLDAASYYHHFSVLKVPVNMTIFQPLQVNIIPVSEPASPSLNGRTCHNIVSEVVYQVEFNGTHGIQKVSVQFKLVSISGNPGVTLQQHFSLHFGSRIPSFTKRRSGNPGYIMGAPLIALHNGSQQPVTVLQNQDNGQCSVTERYKVRFGENMITVCQFSVPFKLQEANCTHLQELLYEVFQGGQSPGSLAITGNAVSGHPGEWNSIFTHRCHIQGIDCMVPLSLEIQVIWAHVGLLSNPEIQVLGGRYYYRCKPRKSLGIYTNVLSLTTAASFTDVTKRPEPPRGQPRVYWKLPYDFFFPFKMALSGAVSSSGSLAGTLLVSLMFLKLHIS
ncbi:tectonic-3 [Varanus komodoensis]|uniref:tectonic-3 n=1 Tax=Varanus komodoensis TaxID=61221 RepID=UPI001CF7D372|nr:tectonic-3 [Varanus komodoensis]